MAETTKMFWRKAQVLSSTNNSLIYFPQYHEDSFTLYLFKKKKGYNS